MKLDEMREMQKEILNLNETRISLRPEIEERVKKYSALCDTYEKKSHQRVENFINTELNELFSDHDLVYRELSSRRYELVGLDIHLDVNTDGINISNKKKEIYLTYILDIHEKHIEKGQLSKYIFIDNELQDPSTIAYDELSEDQLKSILLNLSVAIDEVNNAITEIEQKDNGYNYSYDYYQYDNESQKRNSIIEMLEADL